jgi:hypothetical protein
METKGRRASVHSILCLLFKQPLFGVRGPFRGNLRNFIEYVIYSYKSKPNEIMNVRQIATCLDMTQQGAWENVLNHDEISLVHDFMSISYQEKRINHV